MKKIKRTPIYVEDGRQGILPNILDCDPPLEEKGKEEKANFKDPNPLHIYIGNTRLDRFLESIKEKSIFAIGKLLLSLDWAIFESDYKAIGRKAYHPRIIVGLVLYGIINGQSSLRQLEKLSQSDVRVWWLTGGAMPDHSIIGRFLNRHKEVLTVEFFENITKKILSRLNSDASQVAGDGTVIEAASSRFKLIKHEAAQQAAEEAQKKAEQNPEDKDLEAKAEHAKKVAETAEQRSAARRAQGKKNKDAPVSPTEPEAPVQQQKNKTYRPSYKPSVLANEDRIITGIDVAPSNEPSSVEPMLAQSERISGQEVVRLMLDGGYHCTIIALFCLAQSIDLLCPKGKFGPTGNKQKPKQIPKSDFRYDEDNDVYICPEGKPLIKGEKDRKHKDAPSCIIYRCKDCDGCPRRSECTKSKTGRTVRRYKHEEVLDALAEVMKDDRAREQYKKRQGMVEPVFSDIRYIQGLLRFRRKGLDSVRLEFSLHASAHNIRRYLIIAARISKGGEAEGEGSRNSSNTRPQGHILIILISW